MTLKSRADGLLRGAVESGAVPGVIAMTTDSDGIRYQAAFGLRTLGEATAMSTDTVVWLASMTKALTGAAAMQLVEQGRLALDDPAAQTVPQIAEAGVLTGFDIAGKPILRAPSKPISLRHLLTHTSGFAYEFWSSDICHVQQALGLPGITSCSNAALKTPLLFDPGERWQYGIGLDWVGKMIEAVTGTKLSVALKEMLLGPLGMDDTAFFITPEMRARLAKIHQRGDDGALTALLDLEIPQRPECEMGGGGLYGTMGDYLKFIRMVLNKGVADDGTRVLKARTIELMSRNAMGANRVSLLKSAIPQLTNDAEWFPGLPKTWGLSFQINERDAPTGLPAGSLSWCGLANTYFWIDPKNGVGGVFATQILPFVDKRAAPLFFDFQRAVYGTLN